MEYIYKKLYKLFNKYLKINILTRDKNKLFDCENEYDIENLLWKLKGKKLLQYEKQTIREYKNIFKEKSKLSNSVKRGTITTKTRNIVNKRDKKECQFCGSILNVELAHIISRGCGGSGKANNLISLCRIHHQILDNPVGEIQINKRKKIKKFIKKFKEKNMENNNE